MTKGEIGIKRGARVSRGRGLSGEKGRLIRKAEMGIEVGQTA